MIKILEGFKILTSLKVQKRMFPIKTLCFSILTIMMLLNVNLSTVYANEEGLIVTNSSVYLNGVKQSFSTPTITYNGRTMVPLRFVSEQMNLDVIWYGNENMINLNKLGETTIGEIEWNKNQVYYVELINNIANGMGKVTNTETNEVIIIGNFRHGKLNGYVVVAYSNGGRYEGYWIDDIENGEGTVFYTGGEKIITTFKDGEMEGYGKGYWSNGNLRFEGTFENDGMNGYGRGTSRYDSGAIEYEGTYMDGLWDGFGELYYENGALAYDGQFSQGNLYGYGSFYNSNGELLYEGESTFDEETQKFSWQE